MANNDIVYTSGERLPIIEIPLGTGPSANVYADMPVEKAMRIVLAILAGKVTGANTGTEVFRDFNDTKNAVTITVDDKGNRSNIVTDV